MYPPAEVIGIAFNRSHVGRKRGPLSWKGVSLCDHQVFCLKTWPWSCLILAKFCDRIFIWLYWEEVGSGQVLLAAKTMLTWGAELWRWECQLPRWVVVKLSHGWGTQAVPWRSLPRLGQACLWWPTPLLQNQVAAGGTIRGFLACLHGFLVSVLSPLVTYSHHEEQAQTKKTIQAF